MSTWPKYDPSNHGLPVTCRLGELRPHPAYVRLRLTVPVSKLSALAEQGDLAFREPLVITRERIVIDGYAQLELARRQGRPTLPCIGISCDTWRGTFDDRRSPNIASRQSRIKQSSF